MRRLKRNQSEFQYCLYLGETEKLDEKGFKSGRHEETYAEPVTTKGCIVYKGSSSYRPYGVEDDFSVQIIPNNPIKDITTETKIIIGDETYFVKSHPTTMNEQRLFCK